MKTSAAVLISSTPCTISLQKAASRFLRLWRSSSRSTSEPSLTDGARRGGECAVGCEVVESGGGGGGGEVRGVINHEKSYNRKEKNKAQEGKSVSVCSGTMASAGGNQR